LTETITYLYDALNRLTQTSYSGVATPTVTYAYDGVAPTGCTPAPPSLTDAYPKPRRTAMCDGSGATSWSHDKMGRVLTETRTIVGTSNVTKSVVYTYNLDGSDLTVQYPGTNKIVTYQPGGAGRPLWAEDVPDSINYATGALYAPFGGLTTMVNGGVVTVSNSYSDRLQPLLLSAGTSSTTVLSLCYDFHLGVSVTLPNCTLSASTLGDNGNIYQIANNRDTTRTQNFTYDNLNRLAQAWSSGPQWGETFSVDPWSNMWQRSGVTGKTYYEALSAPANLQNQLTGFTYDVAGNMIQNGSVTYTYDGDNRLTATAGWTYVYDGDGVRVKKSNGSTGTLYWTGTGSEAISESNLAGADQEEYVFFGKRVARRDVASNAVHYYFSDHLGSANIVTNASGGIEDESDYYPYGGEMPITNTVPQNYKFTGKERDAESGLDDFGARYHASALGRFMTPDWDAKPVTVPYAKFGDPQTLNLYSYVENAPVNRADADGHETDLVTVADDKSDTAHEELKAKTAAIEKAKNKSWLQKALSYFYVKTGNGRGVGLNGVKIGPAKVDVISRTDGKDAKHTTDGKTITTVYSQDGVKVQLGPIKVGVERTDSQEEGSSRKVEWLPVFAMGKFEGSNAEIGVGAGGCFVLCGQIEVGVQADKVVSAIGDAFSNHITSGINPSKLAPTGGDPPSD